MSNLDKFFFKNCDDKCGLPCQDTNHKVVKKDSSWIGENNSTDLFFRGHFHKKYPIIRIIKNDSYYVNQYDWKIMESIR